MPTSDITTVYRVFPHVPDRRPDEPGGARFVPPTQGAGRLDNPDHYRVTYVALRPEAAVGEAFGHFVTWSRELLAGRPSLPGSSTALAAFDVSEALLDLDDANALVERDLRPSRVVTRDRSVTQRWALAVWQEQRWCGVRWWSYWNPEWVIAGVWDRAALRLRDVQPLSRDHPALRHAATTLNRPLGDL